MFFNSGTTLTQPAVTTNTPCPTGSNPALGSTTGIALMADIDNTNCVPISNIFGTDYISWSSENARLIIHYNGPGYTAIKNVVGSEVLIAARIDPIILSQSGQLTARLFYTTTTNNRVFFRGSPSSVNINTSWQNYSINLSNQYASNIPIGAKIGIEFSWTLPSGLLVTYPINITINQSSLNDKLIVDETDAADTQALADFRMNEPIWSGNNGEVIDSASGFSGTASSLSAAKPNTAILSPAINGDPGTCRYGVFNRNNKDYIALPATFPNLGANGGAFTITAWIRTTNNTLPNQRIFIDDENNTSGFGFSLADDSLTGRLRFYSRGTPSARSLDTGNVIANNTWYFVAAVADVPNKRKQIYVFNTAGTLLTTVNITWTENSFGSDSGIASIGGETNNAGENTNNFGFAGNIDELKIFQSALNVSQLDQLRQATNSCATLDHVRLSHTGNGVTCTGSLVTVNACNSFDTGDSCTVNTNGLSGNVVARSTGGNVLAIVPFNIPLGNSVTTVSLPVTTAQTVIFETSGLSVTPANTRTCWDGTTANCNHTYNDSGFIFDVPHHIAETSQTVSISAVRKSNNALACTPAFASVSKNVNFRCTYSNPLTGANAVRVNASPLNVANNASAACDSSGRNISLTFNASGVATASFQYSDVGSILLNATYTGSGSDAGLIMTGSDSFIAAPKDFLIHNITSAPIKAGNHFTATVSARNASNATTPNFGREIIPESASLAFSKCQPTGTSAVDGIFSGSLGSFTNGVATSANLRWSEVGNGDLTATLLSGSYLGSSIAVSGNTGTSNMVCNGAGNVGRFIPDHFDTIVFQGCEAGNFTYAAQPFNVQVKAMNASGNVTQNYDGSVNTTPNFAKINTLSDANGLVSGILLNNIIPANAFSQGISNAIPTYIFNSALSSPASIKLRVTDADAVSSASGSVEGSALVRSGRIRIQNAYGSELLDLAMPLVSEYWNNGAWVLNSNDICTNGISLALTDSNSADGLIPSEVCVLDTGSPGISGLGCSAAGSVSKRFREPPGNGNFNLTLKAPGTHNSGSVDVTANVPNWLKYNWTGTGNTNPSARATFGIYKTPIIYLRENY